MILLDTHVLIWLLEGAAHIGERTRALLDRGLAEDIVAVSAISFWETAMLEQKSRLVLRQPVRTWRRQVLELGIQEIPMSGDIGITAAGLRGWHADPADRMIAATAKLHRAMLVSADERILKWTGTLKCRDARL